MVVEDLPGNHGSMDVFQINLLPGKFPVLTGSSCLSPPRLHEATCLALPEQKRSRSQGAASPEGHTTSDL